MPKRGLEPPLPDGNYTLNVARLPIPPLRRRTSRARDGDNPTHRSRPYRVEFSSCHPSLGLSRRGAGMKREPSRASLLPRIILFSNHPLTISFQRRGTSLTPILSEDGEGGGDNPLSINELNSALARQKPAAEQSHPQNKFGRFEDGVRPMERAELRETRGRRVSKAARGFWRVKIHSSTVPRTISPQP